MEQPNSMKSQHTFQHGFVIQTQKQYYCVELKYSKPPEFQTGKWQVPSYQALCYTVRTYVCTNPLLCICSKPDAMLQHICNVTPCWFRASAVAMFCDRKLFKSPCNKGMVSSSLFAVMHIFLSFNNCHVQHPYLIYSICQNSDDNYRHTN